MNKNYYLKNKLHLLEYQKKYDKENKPKKKNYCFLYYKNNKLAIKKQHHNYYVLHRKETIERNKQYSINKRKVNIHHRLSCYLRTRIYQALKGKGKSANTIQLVGCSVERLKFHLESMFQQGMNWDNYGKWHIDHIEPCANFDLSIPEEQTACFHYTNLQPLWAKDNLRKNKY